MSGVASNGNAEHKLHIPRTIDCEQPLREIMALSTAIMAIGMAQDDQGGPNGNMEAVATLADMIRNRLCAVDRVLFPNGSAFADGEVVQ